MNNNDLRNEFKLSIRKKKIDAFIKSSYKIKMKSNNLNNSNKYNLDLTKLTGEALNLLNNNNLAEKVYSIAYIFKNERTEKENVLIALETLYANFHTNHINVVSELNPYLYDIFANIFEIILENDSNPIHYYSLTCLNNILYYFNLKDNPEFLIIISKYNSSITSRLCLKLNNEDIIEAYINYLDIIILEKPSIVTSKEINLIIMFFNSFSTLSILNSTDILSYIIESLISVIKLISFDKETELKVLEFALKNICFFSGSKSESSFEFKCHKLSLELIDYYIERYKQEHIIINLLISKKVIDNVIKRNLEIKALTYHYYSLEVIIFLIIIRMHCDIVLFPRLALTHFTILSTTSLYIIVL